MQNIETSLILGDCINILPSLPDNKFNLIFADSPYNIGINYGNGPQADKLDDSTFVNWCYEWLTLSYSKLADNGSMWILINDEYVSYFDLYMKNTLGMTQRNWIIIYEAFGVQTTKKFARTKRHLLYYVKNPKNFIFNAGEVMVPSARLMKYKDSRANPLGKVDEDIWQMTRLAGSFKERIKNVPTQLPLDLLHRIIKVATNENDWVLDPFAGSFTTGIASKELNRNCVGIEKSSIYYNIANNRLKNHA